MVPDDVLRQAEAFNDKCRHAGLTVVLVESCTGGLLAGTLTAVAGASDVVERGFVTYSNDAKSDQVGVPADLIVAHGAVSREVACAMAEGGIAHSQADIAVAITGVAGPGGGTASKPVGLVHVAAMLRGGQPVHKRNVFLGDRTEIRIGAIRAAIAMMSELADE